MVSVKGCLFENLVISDKCKTKAKNLELLAMFENLVISDKCKTKTTPLCQFPQFENLVISDKCKTVHCIIDY